MRAARNPARRAPCRLTDIAARCAVPAAEPARRPRCDNGGVSDTPDTSAPVRQRATVRRAPKFTVFLVIGAAVGLVAAMVLTFAFHGADETSVTGVTYTQLQVFGFLLLVCVAVGVLLALLVAVVLDRTVGRRVVEVEVARARIRIEE